MSKISICIFALFLTSAVFCAFISDAESSRKPGYCRHEGTDFKEGDLLPARIGQCTGIRCLNAEQNVVSDLDCSIYDLPASTCPLVVNSAKPFPECCPRLVCPVDK